MRTSFPSFDLSFSLNFHNMVDFWALPHLLWLWLLLFFFRKKKKQFHSSKALEQTLVLHIFGNIVYQMFVIIYFTTYQFLGQIFIALNFNYTRQDGQKRSSLLMEWSCRMENRKLGETRIYFRKLFLVWKPWEGKAF